ncbi:catalase [Anabaena cylindrica UHCC 0172]|uniref:catalase n=1 Tax=Anabaena cylindrica TaxID=1165 RepID=UPI002B1EB5C6|nr:catalase [Anabaena cylindrica]MEA5553080.1 catalase [Anabaena cylindrica UHCC 0172]
MKKNWETILFFFYLIGAVLLFSLAAFKNKGRSTHKYGVGGIGTLKVVDLPEFPEHEFWQAGKVFPVQIRHGAVTFEDDAAMDLRSASLKLSDRPEKSPLDIIMNTGPRTFRDIIEFWNFTLASVRGKKEDEPVSSQGLMAYCQSQPIFKEIFAETLRRAPESFSQMYYHSKLVNYFKAKDEKIRYVKYRLIPEDRGVDSGYISGKDWENPWLQKRLPEETRAIDYLRQEYTERLSKQPVIFHLQLRLHEDIQGHKTEIFTQEREWSEETSPWLDLATVTIDRALSFEETEKLSFNIGRQPDSLGAVESFSAKDPNSINAARVRIYGLSLAIRSFIYKQSHKFK